MGAALLLPPATAPAAPPALLMGPRTTAHAPSWHSLAFQNMAWNGKCYVSVRCHPLNRGNVLQPARMRRMQGRQQRERVLRVNRIRH